MPIKWFRVFSDLAEGLYQMSYEKGLNHNTIYR